MANQFNFEDMRHVIDQIHAGMDANNDEYRRTHDHIHHDGQSAEPRLLRPVVSSTRMEIIGSHAQIVGTHNIASSSSLAQPQQITNNNAMMMMMISSSSSDAITAEIHGGSESDDDTLSEDGKKVVVYRAKTPNGSRFLQNGIMKDSKQMRDVIYEAVIDYMFDVMTDEFGNHVFATLVDHCDQPQLQQIVQKLTRSTQIFVAAICNKHGAQSVKRLIKKLEESPLVCRITSLLGREFESLMANRTASYVILKCFQLLNAEQNKELYRLLVVNCIEFATNETACIALNESINHLRQPYRDQLFYRIAIQARFLSQDPTGNYVVQKVLGIHNTTVNQRICYSMRGCFVDFSTQKASSHVVEKCLECEFGMEYVLQDFVEYDRLWRVAGNQYGNYVIQKALKMAQHADSTYYAELVEKLYKDKEKFQNGYGKNVYVMITGGS